MKNFKASNHVQLVEKSKFSCFYNNALSSSQTNKVKGGDDTGLPIDDTAAPPIIIEDIVDI